MKYRRLITLILIFTILINFTFQTKSYSVAVPIAVAYGLPVAEKLIAFLIVSLAVGVTYETLDDAKDAFDKWLSELPEYEPPNNQGGSGNGWKDSLKELLKIGIVAGVVNDLWSKIKDFYTGLGAKEGENTIIGEIKFADYLISDNGTKYYKVTDGSVVYPEYVDKQYKVSNGNYYIYRYYKFHFYKSDNKVYVEYEALADKYDKNDKYLESRKYEATDECYNLNENFYGISGLGYVIDTNPYSPYNQGKHIFKYVEDGNVPDNGSITGTPYYVDPNSPIITGNNPFDEPEWYQPDIISIVPTTKRINSQGIEETIYEGTEDDMIDDIIENITFEDIINSQKREPYTYKEEGTSIVIETGHESEVPYPETEPEPEPDTQTGLGKIISLLKQIINWLSNIYNNISELPQKIGNLFFNPDNIESIDFSPITNVSISNKFPFSIPWDLKRAIEKLSSEGKPPKWEIPIVTETITIDMAEFEHLANIMRIFNTLIFIVALIILTRRLI